MRSGAFPRRRSREKLGRLGNLLKKTLLGEMTLLSALQTLEDKLTDPKTYRLQPMDFLNAAHNQSFVDYGNLGNVCLRAMCGLPLVRAALLSDFSSHGAGSDDVGAKALEGAQEAANMINGILSPPGGNSKGGGTSKDGQKPKPKYQADESKQKGFDPVSHIQRWPEMNLFCRPGPGGVGNEPTILEDQERIGSGIPAMYSVVVDMLTEQLREVDKKAKFPLAGAKHLAIMSKVFNDKLDGPRLLKLFSKSCASLQDLVPSLYIIHEIWGLSGDGGDFTLYDTLRSQVIQVMGDTIARAYAIQAAEREYLARIKQLCKDHEARMEKRRLSTRKAEYEPAWLSNFSWVENEIVPQTQTTFAELLKQV